MYKTIIVTEQQDIPDLGLESITFDQYLAEYPKLGEPRTRVINLCNTATYLSRGYYCSLLAEARQHKVLPSVNAINDTRSLEEGILEAPILLPKGLPKLHEALSLPVYFGWTPRAEWARLARFLFERFSLPAFRVDLEPSPDRPLVRITALALSDLAGEAREQFYDRLRRFTEQVWRGPVQRKFRWDMAIVYNENEPTAPSDPEAIRRFVKAAQKVGINAELCPSDQLKHVSTYDALFIRETTAIDHVTYRLARAAEKEGLVVIDDPTSILRCCNKIFLQDAFSYNGLAAPRTQIVSRGDEATLDRIEAAFDYPLVLKLPESSFSFGVYKVANRDELQARLKEMLDSSALALVQEYLFTEFDWRIGVLNGRPIYACKYYMARDHWQIYNHGTEKKRHKSGGFKTLPTFEVPQQVLKAAVKAAEIIGKGLYGVDLKQRDKQVYVIEVNDNPSIDHRVEDAYLGDELYMMIMQEFADRLEKRGRD